MSSVNQELFDEKQEVLDMMRKYNNKFDYGDFLREVRNYLRDIKYLNLHFDRTRKSSKYKIRIVPIKANPSYLFEKIMDDILLYSISSEDYVEKYFLIFDIIKLLAYEIDKEEDDLKLQEYVEVLNKFNRDFKENWNIGLWENITDFHYCFDFNKVREYIKND